MIDWWNHHTQRYRTWWCGRPPVVPTLDREYLDRALSELVGAPIRHFVVQGCHFFEGPSLRAVAEASRLFDEQVREDY